MSIRRRWSHEAIDAFVDCVSDDLFMLSFKTTDEADHSMNVRREVLDLLQTRIAEQLRAHKPPSPQE